MYTAICLKHVFAINILLALQNSESFSCFNPIPYTNSSNNICFCSVSYFCVSITYDDKHVLLCDQFPLGCLQKKPSLSSSPASVVGAYTWMMVMLIPLPSLPQSPSATVAAQSLPWRGFGLISTDGLSCHHSTLGGPAWSPGLYWSLVSWQHCYQPCGHTQTPSPCSGVHPGRAWPRLDKPKFTMEMGWGEGTIESMRYKKKSNCEQGWALENVHIFSTRYRYFCKYIQNRFSPSFCRQASLTADLPQYREQMSHNHYLK